jgi:tetratricopeptide (TPR) repeat protein
MIPSPALESARVLVAMGRGDEARATLAAILERHPEHAGALALMGESLLHERHPERALPLLRRAVAADTSSAEAANLLARALHALGRDEEALAAARQALSLLADPRNFRETAPVYLTLVWCLRERRLLREALAAAEEGLRRTPDAVLADWASVVEQELGESEKERC